jgi:hypothetical protein
MKKFLKEWQGLWALAAVGTLFWATPFIFRILGMSAGVIDPAYLHALVFTVGVFFTAVFCAWVAVQLDWKILNRYIDSGSFLRDWEYLHPWQKMAFTFGTVAALIASFIACFFALPKP